MAEYIERGALINELNKLSDECEYYGEWEDCISSYEGDLFDVVEKVPTADVQKVRHGSWLSIKKKNIWGNETSVLQCSACKKFKVGNKGIITEYDYCPNCGAKMKKE